MMREEAIAGSERDGYGSQLESAAAAYTALNERYHQAVRLMNKAVFVEYRESGVISDETVREIAFFFMDAL